MARRVNLHDTGESVTERELFDVQIIAMSPQAFTLAGFERLDGTQCAQAWLVAETA